MARCAEYVRQVTAGCAAASRYALSAAIWIDGNHGIDQGIEMRWTSTFIRAAVELGAVGDTRTRRSRWATRYRRTKQEQGQSAPRGDVIGCSSLAGLSCAPGRELER